MYININAPDDIGAFNFQISGVNMNVRTNHISLSRSFFIWLALLISFIFFHYLSISFDVLAFRNIRTLFYIGSGIFLGKYVLCRLVDFHPVQDTLQSVFLTKFIYFALWPAMYLFLFLRLAIVKFL